MGIFSIFSKEKKESLDKGLEKTKTGIFSRLTKALVGKSTVDVEVLDSLEEILVSSDIGLVTTLNIIKRLEIKFYWVQLIHSVRLQWISLMPGANALAFRL